MAVKANLDVNEWLKWFQKLCTDVCKYHPNKEALMYPGFSDIGFIHDGKWQFSDTLELAIRREAIARGWGFTIAYRERRELFVVTIYYGNALDGRYVEIENENVLEACSIAFRRAIERSE